MTDSNWAPAFLLQAGLFIVQDYSSWQPSSWVAMMQSIGTFCAHLVSRSGTLPKSRLSNMQAHISQLKEAFAAFQTNSKEQVSGEQVLNNSLSKLDR